MTTRSSIDGLQAAVLLALYGAAMAIVAIGVAGARALRPSRASELRERLGKYPDRVLAQIAGRPVIWLHAASVGELQGLRALVPALRRRFAQYALVVSTQTRTARAVASRLPDVAGAVYFPLDAAWVRRRALESIRPRLFVFTETELWPGFLVACARREIPCVQASGRLSRRSLARYRWVRPLMRRALMDVDCCAQSQADAERLRALGARPDRVRVAGSLKVEAPLDTDAGLEVARALARLGIEGRSLVVGASTHEGEESALLRGFGQVRERVPELRLLLAPRHPERFESVAGLLGGGRQPWARFSAVADGAAAEADPAVILLDRMGSLRACFAQARLVFVGGTLAPVGGHNVLEPAVEGCAVVVGPHTEHIDSHVRALVAGGAAVQVADASSLEEALASLVVDRERVSSMGAEAARIADAQRGALDRHLEVIASVLAASGTCLQ